MQLKSYVGAHKLALTGTIYFSTSALLSFTISLRLLIQPTDSTKYANAILYYLNYYIIGLAGSLAFTPAFLSQLPRIRQQNRKVKIIFLTTLTVFLVALESILLIIGVQDYIAMTLLVPLATAFYIAQYVPKKNISRKRVTSFLTVLIAASCLLPPITAYFCYNNVISQVSAQTPSEKASFISEFVANRNFDSPQLPQFMILNLRMNSDFQKYLMTGVGACGEMATSVSMFLNMMGLNARKVGFSGEDHAFVEVSINGTWYVLDPGYFQAQILTRDERTTARIAESAIGTISYVITYENSFFIELTQYYVPTDTIIIRILKGAEPIANAQVYLEHLFHGKTQRIPDGSNTFHSDVNGTINLHLGSLSYSTAAENTEPFFRIYVNGIKTGYTVTSTGSNKTQFVEIDLAKLH